MRAVKSAFYLSSALLLFGCGAQDEISDLKDEIAEFRKVVNDMSDVGLISELGWLSKELRDAATGTEAERNRARENAARLFGISTEEMSENVTFEVTLQLSNYDLEDDEVIEVDLKISDSAKRDDVASFFLLANGWQPRRIGDPAIYNRNLETVSALVEQRIANLIGEKECKDLPPVGSGFGAHARRECNYQELLPHHIGEYTGIGRSGREAAIQNFEQSWANKDTKFRSNLKQLILAPTEISNLPPSGRLDGQVTIHWGLTSGIGLYAVAFVPKEQVAENPNLTLHAWLHPKDKPEIILGAQVQIEATDFSSRCLDESARNPTPPVESNTSDGKLCWFAFDLFGNGARARLSELQQEAAISEQ